MIGNLLLTSPEIREKKVLSAIVANQCHSYHTCNSGVRAGLSLFMCAVSAIPRLLLLIND